MSLVQKILGFILIIILFNLFACEESEDVAISVVVKIDTVPHVIAKSVFEEHLMGHDEINDDDKNLLNEAYRLDANGKDYQLILELEDFKKFRGKAKDSTKRYKIIKILKKLNFAILFNSPTNNSVLEKITEWSEITCLMNIDEPKTIVKAAANGQEIKQKWYKVKTDKNTGWIRGDNLIFKTFKETDGIALYEIEIYISPQFHPGMYQRIGVYERGFTMQLTGHEYVDLRWDLKRYRVNIPDQDMVGWVWASRILPDAHMGVVVEDEVILYLAMRDRKENDSKLRYEKMDIVPIIEATEYG